MIRFSAFSGLTSVHTKTTLRCYTQSRTSVEKKFVNLKKWIEENGGYVHEALTLHPTKGPPHWGLRLTRDLTVEEIDEPAIVIPNSIIIDRQRALEDLESVLAKAGCPPMYGRQTVEILMIFIAYHKKQGPNSIWFPLIDCLPSTPPCPWLKQVRDLEELEYDEELQKLINDEKGGNDLIVQHMKPLFGDILGILSVDMMWAYAQAQSILLHDVSGSFWPPLINFMYHDRSYPPLFMFEGGRFVSWGTQRTPMKSGQYLTINLGIESALLLYLSRGIISNDL